jgi:hypothetical protein
MFGSCGGQVLRVHPWLARGVPHARQNALYFRIPHPEYLWQKKSKMENKAKISVPGCQSI